MKMCISVASALALFLTMSGLGFSAEKAEKPDLGKREWTANCATCHGAGGKGDGPLAGYLTKSPGDLTTLAKRNNGVFPVARVYEVIEGAKEVKGHGTRDMPAWGLEYSLRAAEHYRDVDYDPEMFVRPRILAIIDYLYRIQTK